LGLHKKPDVYGAFPVDPYSHTPKHAGAQQPGMTGQVKEDILSRWGELGIRIRKGKINFSPVLLRKRDLITVKETFNYMNLQGSAIDIPIPERSLAFTFCQVPVLYRLGNTDKVQLYLIDGKSIEQKSLTLSREVSQEIFKRSGKLVKLIVTFNESGIGK
jgi:hypothetical protein